MNLDNLSLPVYYSLSNCFVSLQHLEHITVNPWESAIPWSRVWLYSLTCLNSAFLVNWLRAWGSSLAAPWPKVTNPQDNSFQRSSKNWWTAPTPLPEDTLQLLAQPKFNGFLCLVPQQLFLEFYFKMKRQVRQTLKQKVSFKIKRNLQPQVHTAHKLN